MKLGIIGKSAAGKTTLLSLISSIPYESSLQYQFERKLHFVTIKVSDERLNRIWQTNQDTEIIRTTLDIIDTEPLLDSSERESNNAVLTTLKETDGIISVIPCYQSKIDLNGIVREIDYIKTEIAMSDLTIVEKRLAKIENPKGRANTPVEEIEEEKKFLLTLKEYIENGKDVKSIHLTRLSEKLCKNYGLLTLKPLIIILNISEPALPFPTPSVRDEADRFDLAAKDSYKEVQAKYSYCVSLPLKLEYEISLLSPEEQKSFLPDYGLKELQKDEVIKTCYNALELWTFFTVGKGETRAWTIKKGDNIVTAAGRIHTDMARGFIAAEVISLHDWFLGGSWKFAKEHGKLRSEGKEYIVNDGDIINVKFNI